MVFFGVELRKKGFFSVAPSTQGFQTVQSGRLELATVILRDLRRAAAAAAIQTGVLNNTAAAAAPAAAPAAQKLYRKLYRTRRRRSLPPGVQRRGRDRYDP